MVAAGKIAKLSKGKYYKPEQSIFGTLGPDEYQIVKDLLESNGKPIGYLTGYSLFNALSLTTQMSFVIQIGKNEVRPSFKRKQYRISFIRQKNNITQETIPLLQILDSIRFIKKIPDSDIEFICKRLISLIKNLSASDRKKMVRLALKYPAATRALLGTFLEYIKTPKSVLDLLRRTLNPITSYNIYGVVKLLPVAKKWNIK